jgi:hypothetical protein
MPERMLLKEMLVVADVRDCNGSSLSIACRINNYKAKGVSVDACLYADWWSRVRIHGFQFRRQ